ncbi:flagellar basal body rod protein FlgF [Sulfurivirga sp.]|uniref:flagellar basal body rod protein FlgF n=1 Tax=Sulfurivirga sp. TaxID=2614236 RepID=UPI0025DFD55F|nr:flagellar basal body rod protein FlgF [Sulfurivirga sp.]
MDRMVYIAMSGAKEVMLAQANNANNLANATTTGFMQDFNQFRAMHVEGPGWDDRAYALDERPATDFTPGAVKVTGRDLDVVIPNGFLAIQAPDGTESYSRTASMHVLEDGSLVDQRGAPMLNITGAPIFLPPFRKIDIGQDGTISIVPADAPNNNPVVVDQLRLVAPNEKDLVKGEDGFIRLKPGALMGEEALVRANLRLIKGALETSNVNVAQALVNMLELSRKYELQVKMMKTAKDHSDATDKLLRMS